MWKPLNCGRVAARRWTMFNVIILILITTMLSWKMFPEILYIETQWYRLIYWPVVCRSHCGRKRGHKLIEVLTTRLWSKAKSLREQNCEVTMRLSIVLWRPIGLCPTNWVGKRASAHMILAAAHEFDLMLRKRALSKGAGVSLSSVRKSLQRKWSFYDKSYDNDVDDYIWNLMLCVSVSWEHYWAPGMTVGSYWWFADYQHGKGTIVMSLNYIGGYERWRKLPVQRRLPLPKRKDGKKQAQDNAALRDCDATTSVQVLYSFTRFLVF